jgi:membrane dipeptidase
MRRWPGYGEALVVDGLAGPLQFNIPQGDLPLTAEVLATLRRSGITAVNLTVNAPGATGGDPRGETRTRMETWRGEVATHPRALRLIREADDVLRCKDEGSFGLIFGFQDGVPFQEDLAALEDFHELGLRVVQPTYNQTNALGSGCLAPEDRGLTERGREAVERMEELGILLDLSHCGRRTTRDGLAAATGPVSITHTGCAAVYAHPRNKDDEVLRAVARGGGVVGIYLMPFLNPAGPPTAEDVVRHLEHALQVCGEDHVGIGSDQGVVPLDVSGDFQRRFDAVSERRSQAGIAAPREETVPYVPDLNHPRRLEDIADRLAARGHPDRVVEKVLGANFVRLFRDVWG